MVAVRDHVARAALLSGPLEAVALPEERAPGLALLVEPVWLGRRTSCGASARGLARDHELVVATRSLVLLFVPVLLERLRERVEDVTAVILLPVRADDRPVGRPLLALLLGHRLRSVESPASDVFWLLGAIPPRHLQLSPHYLRSTAWSHESRPDPRGGSEALPGP